MNEPTKQQRIASLESRMKELESDIAFAEECGSDAWLMANLKRQSSRITEKLIALKTAA